MVTNTSPSGVRLRHLRSVTGRGEASGVQRTRRAMLHRQIRSLAIDAVAAQRHRHSPTHPECRRLSLRLVVNLDTLGIERNTFEGRDLKPSEQPFTMVVRPLDNTFEFINGFVTHVTAAAMIGQSEVSPRARRARDFLSDLRALDGTEVVMGDAPADAGVVHVMRPEQVRAMEASFRQVIYGDRENSQLTAMTVMGGGFDFTVMPDTVVGELTMTPQSLFSSAAVGQPAGMSPRGTVYSRGIMRGARIFAVITATSSDPLLLHWEAADDGLSARQRAALHALMGHQAAAREAYLTEYPMAVELSLGQSPSDLLRDFSSACVDLRGAGLHGIKVQITRDTDGQLHLRNGTTPRLTYAKEKVLATVDCMITKDAAGFFVHDFSWSVGEGTLPDEVADFFALVAIRATNDRKRREAHVTHNP